MLCCALCVMMSLPSSSSSSSLELYPSPVLNLPNSTEPSLFPQPSKKNSFLSIKPKREVPRGAFRFVSFHFVSFRFVSFRFNLVDDNLRRMQEGKKRKEIVDGDDKQKVLTAI